MGSYLSPVITPCLTQVAQYRDYCVPGLEPCDPNPTDGIIQDCEDTWNRNFCRKDQCWSMPYQSGDKIQMQTRFRDLYNDDPAAPLAGWDDAFVVSLVDSATGEILSSLIADFASRYYVGWDGRGAYQVLEIDTSLPIFEGVTCWHLEFKAMQEITEGESTITVTHDSACSEDFCEIQDCDQYLRVEPIYSRRDGFGYWYGMPKAYHGSEPFAFNPVYRFPIDVVQVGGDLEKTIAGRNTVTAKTSRRYVCEMTELVPPYVFNQWLRMILPAPQIKIESETYTYPGGSVSRENRGSEMFIFSVTLYQDATQEETNC